MVLLHLLRQLSKKSGWGLAVAHLNHCLRGRSSDADERLVRRTGEKLGLPVVIERADVRGFARKRGISLEMAARKLRHDFLARTAARRGGKLIALAHHADDQLELFFLQLLRGSGGEGLAGMKWRSASPSDRNIKLIRPLLDRAKAELRAYAAENKIQFREDASNARLDIQRNRVRHELLPLLRAKYQSALEKTVLRAMEILGAEAEFVSGAAREWLAQMRRPKSKKPKPGGAKHESRMQRSRGGDGSSPRAGLLTSQPGDVPSPPLFSNRPCAGAQVAQGKHALPAGFEDLPVAVQRRVIQVQLLERNVAPEYELVEQLRAFPDQSVNVPQTIAERPKSLAMTRDSNGVVRSADNNSVEFDGSAKEVRLYGAAGRVAFDGAKIDWRLQSNKRAGKPKSVSGRECFDADKIGAQVVLRHWRPGDRFQPIGMASPVKLQDFFTNEKVPRSRRHQLILGIAASGEVFWVEGMRISQRFKLTKETNRRLQWRWRRRYLARLRL